jgi:hypothetical protein
MSATRGEAPDAKQSPVQTVSTTSGEAADAKPPDTGRSRFWRSARDVLAVAGPAGLLTGVLYYFGHVSANAYYSYFGVDLSALDISTTNYLVRSAETLFRPLATLVIIMIVVFVAHHLLRQALSVAGPRWAGRAAVSLCGVAAALGVVGLIGLYRGPLGKWSPLSLAASALVLEYSLWLASRYAAPRPRMRSLIDAGVDLRRGLIAALVLTATFWTVSYLANERGISTARLFEQSLRLKPQAVVYSEKDLYLPGPEVGVTPLNGDENGYRFRYNGLRPLLYARDRWFLLPVGWTHDNGATIIVLQDDPGRVRVDLAP